MQAPTFWSSPPGLLAGLLNPLGRLYGLATRLRRACAVPWRAPAPVLCVGNLTAGGAGKTPTALALRGRLAARGVEAHFVTRGYGGAEKGPHRVDLAADDFRKVGDEALLLAAWAPTWVARDRAAGARAAAAAGAQAIILDDGFQNPSLIKDLSVLVVDAEVGFGNGRMIPAGPLREPVARGLARADAVVLIGDGDVPLPAPAPPASAPPASAPPVLRAQLRPRFTGLSLTGARVVAFAGIGRPEKFFDTLRHMGAVIVEAIPFPDHHPYAPRMLRRLAATATARGAMLATTEKDAARFPAWFRTEAVTVSVALGFDDAEAMETLLDRIVPRTEKPA